MKRLSEENVAKGLPSREEITAQIKNFRLMGKLSQIECAEKLTGKTRSWYNQIENGAIDPIYFYADFVYLYGRENAVSVYGIDWDLYRSDRVSVYYVYYNVNRSKSCETLGCTYTSLRFMLSQPGKYIVNYKEGIDKLFPDIVKDKDILDHFHLVGHNSMAEIDAQKGIAYINMNCANHQTHDTLENRAVMEQNIQYWMDWHKKHDGVPETGIIDLPVYGAPSDKKGKKKVSK